MGTDLETVNSLFDPRNNNKSALELKMDGVVKVLQQLAIQHQKTSQVLDNVSEAVSTLLYCLEKGTLTFDEFQKNLPEIAAKRYDAVLDQMFKNNLAHQLQEVEVGSSVMVKGLVNNETKTLRRSFLVSETENTQFSGKHVGDRIKLNETDEEEFEILTIYKVELPKNAQ